MRKANLSLLCLLDRSLVLLATLFVRRAGETYMDQQITTDVQTLIEQGNAFLLGGQVTEAAAAFSRAVELDRSVTRAHLGVAEANLALGAFDIVSIACRHVLELSPDSADGALARALLFVLDRRYDAAVFDLERVETLDPGRAYAHALRGYCLRQLGRNGDAALAEAKAARLSGSQELRKLFPPVEPGAPQVVGEPTATTGPDAPTTGRVSYQQYQRPWSQRSAAERQMTRARAAVYGVPVVTYTLIGLNVLVYLVGAIFAANLFNPITDNNPIYQYGVQQGQLIFQQPWQAYRLVTAMFLHENIAHIGLNMLSLYFVGVLTERIFGGRRYLIIYLVGGLLAGVVQAIFTPAVPSLGASGAIFAIFGAFGAFLFMRRRALGPVANSLIGQWLFWLLVNLVYGFAVPGIGVADHIGGLVSGFILGAIFISVSPRSRRGGAVV
jgi:membrane associated rhomboid family serine protease